MTFKKMMLLAAMAMAAVAFAAPGAQATVPVWLHEGTPITEPTELDIEGFLSSTTGGGFISGPCGVTLAGVAANAEGAAAGQVEGATIQEECETNIEGCRIRPTLKNFPWSITGQTVTSQKGIAIHGATSIFHYVGQCPVPFNPIAIAGTFTGLVEEDGCFTFDGHQDDLFLELIPQVKVDFLGTFCDATLTLG